MFQFAVPRTSQIPRKSGSPSGVRPAAKVLPVCAARSIDPIPALRKLAANVIQTGRRNRALHLGFYRPRQRMCIQVPFAFAASSSRI